MRLIRNTTPDGSCKYRLWNNALARFEDDDKPGDLNEFFLIKLKDRNSEAALLAYAQAIEPRDPEFAAEVRELAARSGPHHPACKDPDSEPAAPTQAPQDVAGLVEAVARVREEITVARLHGRDRPYIAIRTLDAETILSALRASPIGHEDRPLVPAAADNNRGILEKTIKAIAERWIYRTAHMGPEDLCSGIARDAATAALATVNQGRKA